MIKDLHPTIKKNLQLSNKKTKNLINKWVKYLHSHFTKENKHIQINTWRDAQRL